MELGVQAALLVRPFHRRMATILRGWRRCDTLRMGDVDHQPIRLAALGREGSEDLVEDPRAAPADEAVVDRLVRGHTPSAHRASAARCGS